MHSFNCTQSIYQIEFNEKIYGKDTNDYNIYLTRFAIYVTLNLEDSIILGVIQKIIHREECERTDIFCLNTYQIVHYLNQHEILYKTKKGRIEFINQLTGLVIYGFSCSWGGMYNPPEAIKMIDYVRSKNYKELSNWLNGINPELQAYAIEGLMMLKKKGIIIKSNDEFIIQHLIKRNSRINHCSGCSYGFTITIEDALKYIELHEKWDIFKSK
jgi:hypothetical protein